MDMDYLDVLQKLKREKVVSVIRMEPEKSKETVDALIAGGIRFLEITFTMKNALELIEYLSEKYQDQNVVVGAGTVLDSVSARLAIIKGAKFIVSPCFHKEVAELCNLYRIPYIPGVHNPQDIDTALRSGACILKLFPASDKSPAMLKEFKGPFPQAEFMISGKVNKDNLPAWLEYGAFAVCLGSALTDKINLGQSAVSDHAGMYLSLAHEMQ